MSRFTLLLLPFVAVLAATATIMADRVPHKNFAPLTPPGPLQKIRPQNGVISIGPASSSSRLSRARAVRLAHAYMPNLFARGHLASVRYGNVSYREGPASAPEIFADTWVITVDGVNDTMPSMAMDPSIRNSSPAIHGYAIFIDDNDTRAIHAIGLF